MIFKIRPDENPFSAPSIFNHSSANFDPTELCQTILESLGRGKKGGVFEFAKNCPNKKWQLAEDFQGIGCNFLAQTPINLKF